MLAKLTAPIEVPPLHAEEVLRVPVAIELGSGQPFLQADVSATRSTSWSDRGWR